MDVFAKVQEIVVDLLVVEPEEVTLEQAIKLNIDGMKHDGYQEIKEDGTIILVDEACRVYEELLKIDIDREVRLDNIEERARKLLTAYKKVADAYKTPTYLY